MIQIGTTAVCKASHELGAVYDYLTSLSVTDTNEASEKDTIKIAKDHLNYHKMRIIVISSISFFEQEIYEIIKETYKTNKNSTLEPFIDRITQRRYHQLFEFNTSNINKFYSFFGEKFKEWCQKKETEDSMSKFVKSFMLLNKLRNKLVHEGYDYNVEYRSKHLYDAFEESCKMLNWLSESLKEFEENKNKSD